MQLGVMGLGTMGSNIARNAARNGATVVVLNRSAVKMTMFLKAHGDEGQFIPCRTFQDLVKALKSPRPILLMVKAGDAVEETLSYLTPLLMKGDIVIDGGNSHYRDTKKRCETFERDGLHYMGLGVSGGEKGALNGPSMMAGGSKKAYDAVAPLLTMMAADDGEGGKCVAYLGPEGAGHFVKTIHNGIEYGIIQLIAECYHLLRQTGGLKNSEIADLFEQWNAEGNLRSFLVEITSEVLRQRDDQSEGDLIDMILDTAEQKGTGGWAVEAALAYGVAIPTITAAVEARIISSGKGFRVKESERSPLAFDGSATIEDLPGSVCSALELSVIHTYAQGFQMLSVASEAEKWKLPLSEIARIWRGGCIIRSELLRHFQKMFAGDEDAAEAVRSRCTKEAQLQWRNVVALGAKRAIPLPAISASLHYYDAYRTARLPQNLIQGLRDNFGVHGYERVDRPGMFHTNWN